MNQSNIVPRKRWTMIMVHELYPSKEALDEAMSSGSTKGWSEQFEQLDALIDSLGAGG